MAISISNISPEMLDEVVDVEGEVFVEQEEGRLFRSISQWRIVTPSTVQQDQQGNKELGIDEEDAGGGGTAVVPLPLLDLVVGADVHSNDKVQSSVVALVAVDCVVPPSNILLLLLLGSSTSLGNSDAETEMDADDDSTGAG